LCWNPSIIRSQLSEKQYIQIGVVSLEELGLTAKFYVYVSNVECYVCADVETSKQFDGICTIKLSFIERKFVKSTEISYDIRPSDPVQRKKLVDALDMRSGKDRYFGCCCSREKVAVRMIVTISAQQNNTKRCRRGSLLKEHRYYSPRCSC
jgi:hypothetical protein